MKTTITSKLLVIMIATLNLSCEKEKKIEKSQEDSDNCVDTSFFDAYRSSNFLMGFSTWPYAKSAESVDSTYIFISNNATIYSEHIDSEIPWEAWINDLPLPEKFTDEIEQKKIRKLKSNKLTLSVSLLNLDRDDLAPDFDGETPDYAAINDSHIEDAYFLHLQYIINQLNPDYLILAIEVNLLLEHYLEKWTGYKSLMTKIKSRIKQKFPSLKLSESITLHNLYQPEVPNSDEYIHEIVNYINSSMDFASISFYPFFKGLTTKEEFQKAFDFLHNNIKLPIAFSETGHLSETLSVEDYDILILGNQCQQNQYLETLLTNAQNHNYTYIIWWTHRDYDELWKTFPKEVQSLGKLWISTGLINEDGLKKNAFSTWEKVLKK
jgi:hypothetical protein